MVKRMIIALAGLFAVLGLAVGTAGAAPSAANSDAGVLAADDLFRAWAFVSYEGADEGGARATFVRGQSVNFAAVRHSAALVDSIVQVQLFSGTKTGPNTCGGTPVATLNAANMADSGWVATSTPGSPRTLLGDPTLGAQCWIAT